MIAINTPNFSWGSFSFILRSALAPPPLFFQLRSRAAIAARLPARDRSAGKRKRT